MTTTETQVPAWLARVQTLSQLNNEDIPEMAWIVDGLVTEGLTVLAGMLKAGKSYLVVNIGLAISEDRLALGQHKVKPGRVLYITPDDKQKARLKARITAMREGRTDEIPFDIATDWRSLDDGGIDDIDGYIDYFPDTQLVIIDVLMNVLPDIREGADAYSEIYQKLEPLKALSHMHHVAIVLVMHMNKGGQNGGNPRSRIYGSMAYGAIADNILLLDEDYTTHQRFLMTTGKDLDQRRDALEFNRDTGVYVYGEKRAVELQEEKASQDIGTYIRFNMGATRKQIVKWLEDQGVKYDTADKRVTRAKNNGDIVTIPGYTGFYPPDWKPYQGEDSDED